ncbi:MAG: thiamine diphosphokinase, partial [Selenomonas sp.]|nr:thiamine diphosphokinase [Selenomonas sp.]
FLHVDESLTVTCDSPPQAISLLPFTEECTGITTNGLRWELNHAQIHTHSSTTISNVLAEGNTEHRFSVALGSGILGVYLCHKE